MIDTTLPNPESRLAHIKEMAEQPAEKLHEWFLNNGYDFQKASDSFYPDIYDNFKNGFEFFITETTREVSGHGIPLFRFIYVDGKLAFQRYR
jgi:hypothetical protein